MQNEYFRLSGDKYQQKHLLDCVEVAWQKGNDIAARKILAMMQQEKLRLFWRKLNYSCGKKRGGSLTSIQVEGENDTVVEYNTQESVENAIWDNIHLNGFYLAEAAPICNRSLRVILGIVQHQLLRKRF